MSRRHKCPLEVEVRRVLANEGVTDVAIERGAVHPKAVFVVGGRRVAYYFSGTATGSRGRTLENTLAGIRRAVRLARLGAS